jgi:hypothetical protein
VPGINAVKKDEITIEEVTINSLELEYIDGAHSVVCYDRFDHIE